RDVASASRGVRTVRMGDVLRVADSGKVQAVGRKPSATASTGAAFARQRAVLLEEFVADAHLHVVSLTGKDHQRFVLRLPAKTGDGAIVTVAVEGPGDAESIAGLRCLIVQQGRVVNVRDQARAKQRRGNAENQVVGCRRLGKAGLRQTASAGIRASAHGKYGLDAAVRIIDVGCAVGVKEKWEAGFAHRASSCDERWNG